MKNNIIFSFILILMSSFISTLVAQNQLQIEAFRDVNGDVYLRWIPDEKIFESSMSNGFKLVRYTQWAEQTEEEFENSKIVLIEHTVFSNVSPKTAQALAIINANVKDSISNERTLKDAVNYKNNKSSQYIYTMLIADRDFVVAKDLGLAFIDKDDKEIGKTYFYEVSILNKDISSSTSVKYENETTLPLLPELKGSGDNKKAVLSWDRNAVEESYSAFFIYKDNICINAEDPYTPMIGDDNQKDLIYIDNLEDNTTTHDYSIEGINVFGKRSEKSNVVSVKGVPPALDMQLSIDSLHFNPSDFVIHWKVSNPAAISQIIRFDVYRLITIDGKAEKMNTSPLSNTESQFTITNPVSAAYYYVEAVDVSDRTYPSIAVLGQPKDKTPPAAPSGLTGFISRTGEVKLKWDNNTEPDLDGYLVFYSNYSDGDYSQWTSKPNKSNEYNATINTSFSMDSIFIKIAAVDVRFNKSPYSQVLRMARPDITAPAKPIIHHLLGRETGVRIAWSLPTDNDLASIVLQRKFSSGSNWKIIHTVNLKFPVEYPLEQGELLPSNFVDSSSLEHRSYDYRLVAEDNSHNVSISDKQSVRPYDDGIRGNIFNFNVALLENELKYLDLEGHTIGVLDAGSNPGGLTGGDHPSGGGGTVNGSGNSTIVATPKAVRLRWKYNTEYNKSLIGFRIYRKSPVAYSTDAIVTTPDYILLKTVTKDRATRNATFFNMDGYLWFDRTVVPIKTGKYEYKIIAEHSDGGVSTWSEVLEVIYH